MQNILNKQTTQEIKQILINELLEDCKNYNLDTKSRIVNFFYTNYVDQEYDTRIYNFLLLSDRHVNNSEVFNEYNIINFLVNERFTMIDFENLVELNILK